MCRSCYQGRGSLLHCLSTLTAYAAVYFCCTGLGVTSTGRYPASCPMKPGLSSPVLRQPRSFVLLDFLLAYHLLNRKATSTDKFPADGITWHICAVDSLKIFQELQKPFCLVILRFSLLNAKQQRLCILFQHSKLIN